VLTNAAKSAEKISRTAAQEELDAAKAEKATTDEAMEAVANKIDRARKLVKMATAE